MPSTSATRMLRKASSRVIGTRSRIVAPTLRPARRDSPKSPVTACVSHAKYWTGSGSSRPYFVRMSAKACGERSSPASTSAGSPGSARVPANTTMLARRTTISAAPALRRKKPRTALRPRREARLLEPQEAVAEELDPGHLLLRAEEVVVVPQVDQRVLVEQHLRHLLVDLGALALVERRAALVQQRVELRVGVAGVVLGARLADELLRVAVGVDAPGPSDLEDVEVTGVALVERGRELGRLQLHLEAGVLRHRLDDLAHAQRERVGVEHDLHRDRGGDPALRNELLGTVDVPRRALEALVVVRADGGDRPASRGVGALEGNLVDRVAVEREAERLAQLLVLRERRVELHHRLAEPVLVADVDRQPLVAQRGAVQQLQVRVAADGPGVGRVQALGDVDDARAQVRGAGAAL